MIIVPLILSAPHADSSSAAPYVVNSELSWAMSQFAIEKDTSKMLVSTDACVSVQSPLADRGLLVVHVLKSVAALQ